MSALTDLNPLTPIVNAVMGLIDRVIPDPSLAAQEKQKILDAQSGVIIAEAKGESWLQRNWRPLTMLSFVFIIINNFIIYPYLNLFWHQAPLLPIPTDMWDLLKLGISGYIVGRSVEKTMQHYAVSKGN